MVLPVNIKFKFVFIKYIYPSLLINNKLRSPSALSVTI